MSIIIVKSLLLLLIPCTKIIIIILCVKLSFLSVKLKDKTPLFHNFQQYQVGSQYRCSKLMLWLSDNIVTCILYAVRGYSFDFNRVLLSQYIVNFVIPHSFHLSIIRSHLPNDPGHLLTFRTSPSVLTSSILSFRGRSHMTSRHHLRGGRGFPNDDD